MFTVTTVLIPAGGAGSLFLAGSRAAGAFNLFGGVGTVVFTDLPVVSAVTDITAIVMGSRICNAAHCALTACRAGGAAGMVLYAAVYRELGNSTITIIVCNSCIHFLRTVWVTD